MYIGLLTLFYLKLSQSTLTGHKISAKIYTYINNWINSILKQIISITSALLNDAHLRIVTFPFKSTISRFARICLF